MGHNHNVRYNVYHPCETHRQSQSALREIAAAAGISIGTVDRALHNRAGVNPKTRNQVLKIAEKLGYKPNIAARTLKLNRRLRIAAHLPRQIASFFDPSARWHTGSGGGLA